MLLFLLFTFLDFKYSDKDFSISGTNSSSDFVFSKTFTGNNYSDKKYEGITSTIIINEEYESDHIINSQFINPNLSNNQEYLFIIQKEFFLENILFSFLAEFKNKIGAIKIETDDQITIRNCTFITNSNNGADIAIFISSHPKNERKRRKEDFNTFLVEKNIFLNFNTAISTFSDRISIIDNDIVHCRGTAIYIASQFSSQSNFDLMNNRIRNCTSSTLIKINGQLTKNPTIQGNIFEYCNDTSSVFSLSLSDSITEILFENNTFRNFKNLNKFVDFNSKSSHFDVDFFDCHFIDNAKCSSENGGGIEILFHGPEKVIFNFCQFLNNFASQKIERETISEHQNDGIMFVDFISCLFRNNEAFGKGGAIFIQKVENLVILNCSFNCNKANQRCKKTFRGGLGGAIYYKSTFSPKCQLNSVQISDCTFTSNSAFDGFSLYIECEEKNQKYLTFSLIKNIFTKNYQNGSIEKDAHKNDRAVIATEFAQIIEKENELIENEVKLFSHVDSKGNPIQSFSRRLKQDYSNGDFNGEVGPIYINDQFTESSIENSFFNLFSVSNENYLFIVQKEFSFLNVQFNLSSTGQKFGAIKIECTESVTILNCLFNYCGVSNGALASVIHNSFSDYFEINNCIFSKCGVDGKKNLITVDRSPRFELINTLFKDCNGGINIQVSGSVNIKNNNFTNNNDYINITDATTTSDINEFNLYNNNFINSITNEATIIFHSYYGNSDIKIGKCYFFNCTAHSCCYFNIKKLVEANVNISNCCIKKSAYDDYNYGVIGFKDTADSIGLLIDLCTFDDIVSSTASIITLETNNDVAPSKSIKIINSVFNVNPNYGKLAIVIKKYNAVLTITNCTFVNCCRNIQHDSMPWANTISVDKISKLEISECFFDRCGFVDAGNVIGILGLDDTQCIIKDCIFNYTSAAISTYVEGTTIINNNFYKCDINTVRVASYNGLSGFNLINNIFDQRNPGAFINMWSRGLKYQTTISGNTFKNVFTVIDPSSYEIGIEFFLIISVENVFPFIFENNKFINFHSINTGFKINVNSQSNFDLQFINCSFINNTSDEVGGSFGCPIFRNYDTFILTFSDCYFVNNTAKENGGALHIRANNDVNIISCTFNNNHVSDGHGGAIFIEEVNGKLTIDSCLFTDNSASEGNAIYVNNSIKKIVFKQNLLINNINQTKSTTEDQFMIVFNLTSVDLVDISFESTKDWKIYPILFLPLELKNINLRRVNSLYSSLLYISAQVPKPLYLGNFLFEDCQCKNYLFDINCISNTINSNITLNNCTFLNCKSNQGAIYTSPHFYIVFISRCIFASCFGDNFSCFNLQCRSPIIFEYNSIFDCLYNHNLGEINIITASNKVTQMIRESIFSNNTKISKESVHNSGILFNSNSPLFVISLNDCTFVDNSASVNCGGSNCFCKNELNNAIEIEINYCDFTGNFAGVDGGALLISNIDTFTIESSKFINNYCQGCGGAISLYYESLLTSTVPYCIVKNCVFESNCAEIYGNSLFLNDFRQDVNYSFVNNIFLNNYCDQNDVGFVIVSRKEEIEIDSNDFNNDDESVAVNPIYYINLTDDVSPSQIITQTIEITETIEITQTNEVTSVEDTKSIEDTKPIDNTKSIDNTKLIDNSNTNVDYSIIQSFETNTESANVSMEKSKGKKKNNLMKLILYSLILAFEVIMIIIIIIIFILIKKRMNNYEKVESFTDDSL